MHKQTLAGRIGRASTNLLGTVGRPLAVAGSTFGLHFGLPAATGALMEEARSINPWVSLGVSVFVTGTSEVIFYMTRDGVTDAKDMTERLKAVMGQAEKDEDYRAQLAAGLAQAGLPIEALDMVFRAAQDAQDANVRAAA